MSGEMRQRNVGTTTGAEFGSPMLKPSTGHLLISWDELPEWMRDNEFIMTGFRPASNSYVESLQSLTYLHNQTVNIYSHLFAAFATVCSAVLVYHIGVSQYPTATKEDRIIFGVFFLGMIICYSLSAAFHTFANHSHTVQRLWVRLDLLGIFIVTFAAFVPGVWYTYPCDKRNAKLSWIILDLGAQLSAAVFTLFVPGLRTPPWRSFRVVLFIVTCSSAFCPIIYACHLHGTRRMATEAGAAYYVLAALTYLMGAGIYARWPERWRPGYYDIWGNSHQLFHVLIVLGLVAHLGAFLKAFDYQQRSGHC